MLPWNLIDEVPVPGGDLPLRFLRRGHEFSIRVGNLELMNSRQHGSEDALGAYAGNAVADSAEPYVVVGGLGMGFTLRAVLDALPSHARIEVVELEPSVVRWNEGDLGELTGHPLRDPRVVLRIADVADVIRSVRGRADAILLDVDNGPEAFTRDSNHGLYGAAGLATAYAALRPGGAHWTWSSGRREHYTRKLQASGFAVREHTVRADRGKKGARHVLWEARRPE